MAHGSKTPADAQAPGDLAAFVADVAERSYRITEATVADLKRAGHADDVIFEALVVAAAGAANRRSTSARCSM